MGGGHVGEHGAAHSYGHEENRAVPGRHRRTDRENAGLAFHAAATGGRRPPHRDAVAGLSGGRAALVSPRFLFDSRLIARPRPSLLGRPDAMLALTDSPLWPLDEGMTEPNKLHAFDAPPVPVPGGIA